MKVGLTPEGLADLQRTYLGLHLVLFIGALLADGLPLLVLLFHDTIDNINYNNLYKYSISKYI